MNHRSRKKDAKRSDLRGNDSQYGFKISWADLVVVMDDMEGQPEAHIDLPHQHVTC